MSLKLLEQTFIDNGFTDFKWIKAQDIIVAQWVRFRCMFGCDTYGKCATCPPHVPSIEECRKMILEYTDVAVFHFSLTVNQPQDRKPWSKQMMLKLLDLERIVFKSGYYKAMILQFDNCELCNPCSGNRVDCKNPHMARPGADALGIDVFATVRNAGYSIDVLKNYSDVMNRYAFLLVQ